MSIDTEPAKDPSIFDGIDKDLLARFKRYHQKNPHVFEKFVEHATAMRRTGREKYSAWCIVNVVRWESDLSTEGEVFKISNDFIALYARLLIYHRPDEFKDFFDLRPMKEKRRWPSQEEKRLEARGGCDVS